MGLISKDDNLKMKFARFNLPCKRTCPGSTTTCRRLCYAQKAEKRYPTTVKPFRTKNYKESKGRNFVEKIIHELKRYKKEYFRIHESGDFYDQEYLDKWIAICKQYPNIKFLAFSKSFHLDYSNKPSNLQIVWSVMQDSNYDAIPAGPRAYAGECKEMINTIECQGFCDNCGICWELPNELNVHFKIH